jgi:hypothetical protein
MREEAGPRAGLLRLRPATRLGVACVAALALVACSGEDRLSKSEYEQKVVSEYANVQKAFRAIDGTTTEEFAADIEDAEDQLRATADELGSVTPPGDVEEPHKMLVKGMRGYADDLEELREDVRGGDEPAVAQFNDRVAENVHVRRISEAAEEMIQRGYELGPLEPE